LLLDPISAQTEALENLTKDQLVALVSAQAEALAQSQASEAQLSRIFDSSLQSLTLINSEHKILYFNQASAERNLRVFGKKMAVGDAVVNYIFPEDLVGFERAMQLVLNGENYWIIKSFQDSQGQTRWFEVNLTPVRDAQNQILAVSMAIQPRTELMMARQNIQTSQNRLNLALRSTRLGICEWDLNTGTMLWDEQLLAIYGAQIYSRLSPLDTWLSFIHSEDRQRIQLLFESIRTGEKEHCQQDFRIVLADASVRWIRASALVEKDQAGNILRVIGTQQDITDSHTSEEQLRFQSFLLNSVGQAVIAVDAQGGLTFWNQAAEKLYGLSKIEAKGTGIFSKLVGLQSSGQIKDIKAHIFAGDTWSGELSVKDLNGDFFNVFASVSPLLDAERQLEGVVGISSDITALKNVEASLKQALQEKDVLLRELYHRTKNNLQVICSMLGLQRMAEVDSRFQQQLQALENRIHAMALVHQMLYRSEHLSRLNLKDYLTQLGALLLDSCHAEEKLIRFENNCEDIFVLIDTAMPCGLIFTELLANIFKHAFPVTGGIIRHSLVLNGDEVIWDIADTGLGLPEGFDPEVQGNMGLQTALVLIEQQLQGSYTLTSLPGKGTLWQIRFLKNLFLERV
jgi:PAS domain S-box-containing protein